MKAQTAYLLGLICARGHFFESENRILIEFAHKNETVEGIASCPKCGNLATKRRDNNPEGNLYCKGCGEKVPNDIKKEYKQKDSTIHSLEHTIIPYLKEIYDAEFDIVGNDSMTFLVLSLSVEQFNSLAKNFDNMSFDSFERIPQAVYKASNDQKREFVGGFLDAAGFFNAGGWLPRTKDGKNGRMRGYFQIVRNWMMPVLMCNFLKDELGKPIQTLDWGHPNTRDSNMEGYHKSGELSWSREHQLKFFPEYYDNIPIRIEHKKRMFDELVNHNEFIGFKRRSDCTPPNTIRSNQIKAYHPAETYPRIPKEARKHSDAYWQICHNMGCIYSNNAISHSSNPDYYYLTGKDEEADFQSKRREFKEKREKLTRKLNGKYKQKIKASKGRKSARTSPEQDLYDPISDWLEKYLSDKYKEDTETFDTSAYYLDRFIHQNNLLDEFDFSEEYKIKPDIVGFLMSSKDLVFVEVKVGALSLQDIGQLLGYSLIGMPEEAILVSPKKPSAGLMTILASNPSLLEYGNKKIQIGVWDGTECKLH